MSRKRKKPSERLIIFGAIHAGHTYEQVNVLLKEANFNSMNENSYKMVKKSYVPHIFGSDKTNQKLRDQIEHPSSMAGLKKLKKEDE